MDGIYKRAKDAGLKVEYLKEMHPRAIKDTKGFVEFFLAQGDQTSLEYGLSIIESDLSNTLDNEQKAEIINGFLRGKKANTIELKEPSALKDRQIPQLTPEMNQFYFSADASLLHYFFSVNSAIETNRFFGRGVNENGRNVEDSIGAFTLDLLQKGEISFEQEKELAQILKARFNQKGTHGIVTTFKNLSYIDILGSPIKAITQLGDVFIAAYKNGVFNTLSAAFNLQPIEISREDLGITEIGVEFEEGRISHAFAKKVFDLVGFTAIDSFGKNTVIRGAYLKHKKAAEKGDINFLSQMTTIFGEEAEGVVQDLLNDRVSPNVKFLLASDLMDIQPVALSEMPEAYNRAGNWRVLYMLKSFTIKLLDVYRNDVYNQFKTNPKAALKNFINLSIALTLSGAGPDLIKDLVLGRPINIPDTVVDNIMKIVGFNKFLGGKLLRQGPRAALMEFVFPPLKGVDGAFKDFRTVLKDGFEPLEWEIINSIPVGGELYYWWFGRGRTKVNKKKKKKGKRRISFPPRS